MINCTDKKSCKWESRLNYDSNKAGVMCEANLAPNYNISESSHQKRNGIMKDFIEIPAHHTLPNYQSTLKFNVSTSEASSHHFQTDGNSITRKTPGGDGWCRPETLLMTVLMQTFFLMTFALILYWTWFGLFFLYTVTRLLILELWQYILSHCSSRSMPNITSKNYYWHSVPRKESIHSSFSLTPI